MPNKAKVLAGLKFHLSTLCVLGEERCPYFKNDDCDVVLMKEAEELLKDSEPVVRCKDCRWWRDWKCENDYVHQQIYDDGCYPDFHTDSEWFCAEGERR